MNPLRLEPNSPEVELLLATERELVPEPDDFRESAVARARASLPREPVVRLAWRDPSPQRRRIGVAVAAAVVLFALCSLAFFAGYRIKATISAAPGAAPTLAPPVVAPPVVAPPVVAPPIVAPPDPLALAASSPATTPEPAFPGPTPARTRSARSVLDVESYPMERRVLQPAQQAVARRDFGAALPAIAEHQHRFPSGQLAEEREALRVKALLGLGRTAEAQRAGAAFRERFPHSALLARIDEMVGTPR